MAVSGPKSKKKYFSPNQRLGPLVHLHTRLEGYPRGYSKNRNKVVRKLAANSGDLRQHLFRGNKKIFEDPNFGLGAV